MIYLTETRTACTETLDFIDELKHFPQQVHWFPETYKGKDTGMIYAPHRLAEKVLDGELLQRLRQAPTRTAFILGNLSLLRFVVCLLAPFMVLLILPLL